VAETSPEAAHKVIAKEFVEGGAVELTERLLTDYGLV